MTTTTSSQGFNFRRLLRFKDASMAFVLIVVIVLMLIPLPTVFVDLLVVVNLAVSLEIILLTVYISKPMDFSVFPSVLLMVTLFRLGLNVSASRLILLSGDAGRVIATFGSIVVGGNYVVGVVVFIILMIIQFVVINNGAGQRRGSGCPFYPGCHARETAVHRC